MTIKNKDINTLNKLLFYSRELFKEYSVNCKLYINLFN